MDLFRLHPGLLGELMDLIYHIGFTESHLFHMNQVARILLQQRGDQRVLAGRMLYLAGQVRAAIVRANEILAPCGLRLDVSLQGVTIRSTHPQLP